MSRNDTDSCIIKAFPEQVMAYKIWNHGAYYTVYRQLNRLKSIISIQISCMQVSSSRQLILSESVSQSPYYLHMPMRQSIAKLVSFRHFLKYLGCLLLGLMELPCKIECFIFFQNILLHLFVNTLCLIKISFQDGRF